MDKQTAEHLFRQSFDRLKTNQGIRLPKDTPVSQNNVAKEAGVDPSALRKSRYPSLISEIQEHIATQSKGTSDCARLRKNAIIDESARLKERVNEISAQRDHLADHLNRANEKILALSQRIFELETKLPKSDVIKFPQNTTIKLDS
ncbi:MAG: hypothetical protein ACOH2K_04940 [Burkholderiaceae bacterium]